MNNEQLENITINEPIEEDKKDLTSFEQLRKIDLKPLLKKKMNMTYLSWASAWDMLKKLYPDAIQTIYKQHIDTEEATTVNDNGLTRTVTRKYSTDIPYFNDGKTCWVEVGVTINGKEYIETYPVMDARNNAVRVDAVTMTAVNKALQRAFVKACARHGLGLYIYAGEDLPGGAEDKTLPNIKDILNKADSMSVMVLDEPKFVELLNTTIQEVKTIYDLSEDASAELNHYITDLFKGQRLSQLTVADSENLQRLNYFASELIKALK